MPPLDIRMPRLQLVTLCPSHYCEKARWALHRSTTSFDEIKHLPVLHIFFVKKLGGPTSLPKLIITNDDAQEKTMLHDSSDILAFTDTLIEDESLRLYPADLKEAIETWENQFNNVLGPHIRRWAYCHLLYRKNLFSIISHGASTPEKVFGFLLLPLLRFILFKAVGCGKENAKEISFRKVTEIFQKVDEALADGRPFICGNNFTAADLTFASLGAPAVLPKGYGALLPTLEMCPPEMAESIKQLRNTAAGKHILKMYDTYRYKSAI